MVMLIIHSFQKKKKKRSMAQALLSFLLQVLSAEEELESSHNHSIISECIKFECVFAAK